MYILSSYPYPTQYLPSIRKEILPYPTVSTQYPTQYLPCYLPNISPISPQYLPSILPYLPSILPGIYPVSPLLSTLLSPQYLPGIYPVSTLLSPCSYPLHSCVLPVSIPAFFPEGIRGRYAGSGVSTPKQFRIKIWV